MKKTLFMVIVLILIFSNSFSILALTQYDNSKGDEILNQNQTNKAIKYYKNNYLKADVISIQSRLNELGFDCGKVDGIIGKRTVIAVALFQKSKNITPDGIAGNETKALLGLQTNVSINSVQDSYTVKFLNAYLDYNNSVGNDWSIAASVDNKDVYIGDSIEIRSKSKISITAKATENDTYSDYGSNSTSIKLVDIISKKNGIITVSVIVRENRGRYSGNTAKWIFEFEVSKK